MSEIVLSAHRLSEFPPAVKSALLKLDSNAQQDFLSEYDRRRKSVGAAYALWFFLGWHYAYVGKWGVQFLYWLTAGDLLIWAIADLFRMPGIVGSVNGDRAVAAMRDVKALSS